jgi:hypothetical protein
MPFAMFAGWTQLVIKVLLTGISFLILFIICELLVIRIHAALKVKTDREHVIKLTNRGNFPSVFQLSVASSEKQLGFGMSLNGIPLVPVPVVEEPLAEEPEEEVQPAAPAASQAPAGQTVRAAAASTAQPAADKKKSAVSAEGAAKGGQAVAGKMGLAATILGTLGELLPGSLGKSFRANSTAVRDTQSKTISAAQAPVNTQRNLDSLKEETGKVAPQKPAAAAQPQPKSPAQPPAAFQPQASASNQPGAAPSQTLQNTQTPSVHSKPIATKKEKALPSDYLVQTQPLEPGAAYSLTLKIGGLKRRYPQGTFAYTVKSLQMPRENVAGSAEPVVREGVVHFPRVGIWRFWIAPFTNILVMAIMLLIYILIFRIIWL